MRFLSVCSGIEAASCAWEPLGWKGHAFSEIEAFPCSVLKHHYPETPNWGDMTKFKDWPDADVDLLVGGTPCQSFSVAGLRKGLADPRGNLALTYLAIAARNAPRWICWENVPGVLSSGQGRDFGAFLGGLGQLGYGWAYRVLDAQFFGVPQRRRRVFVVGYLGDWRRAAAVLFERHSLSGHPAPRREKGQSAPTIPSRSTAGSGLGTDFDCDGGLVQDRPAEIAPTLYTRMSDKIKLENQHIDNNTNHFITHSLRTEGFDASEDGTGRGTPLVPVTVGTLTSNGDAHSGFKDENGLVAFGAQMSTPHWQNNLCDTMQAKNPKAIAQGSAVRRLTPRECERLQGFPDDYTLVPHRGKPAADGPRYKALGNSMAVPVMCWIGERIQAVEAISAKQEAA